MQTFRVFFSRGAVELSGHQENEGVCVWEWPIHLTMIRYETKNIVFEIQRMRCRWFGQTINECIWFGFRPRATMATSSFNDRCAVRASDDQLNRPVDISWIWIFYINVTWIIRSEGRRWCWWLVDGCGGWWVGSFYHAQRKNHFKQWNDSVFWFIYAKIISVCKAHIQ